MNEVINKCSLALEFMPKTDLRQSTFTYSARGPKNKIIIQKFIETGDSRYIYRNELDKACFLHDMAYEDFKDFPGRTVWDKVLRDKTFNIAKNPKYDEYRKGLASMVYKFVDGSAKNGI